MDTRIFHPDRLAFFMYYAFGALFMLVAVKSLFALVLGVFFIILAELLRRAETFKVSPAGVERDFDLVSTGRVSANFDHIQDVGVRQGLLDRLFGIGSVYLNTAGSSRIEISFRGVKDPYAIAKLIRDRMNALKPATSVGPT